nr:LamG domain-containing protein [Chloroflexota bacterium]
YNHTPKYILTKGRVSDSTDAPYFVEIESNRLIAGERVGSINRTLSYDLAANAVTANAWHHVAATMQASSRQLTLYLDGRQVLHGTLAAHATTGTTRPLFIGRNGNVGQYWQGKLDDVRVWNRVRSDVEILRDYRTELTGAQVGLVGNWKLNEGSGTTAADSGGTPQNATLKGSAGWSTDLHP